MLTFIIENIGTIIVGLIVLAIVAAIVRTMVRDKRNGKILGCDCGCGSCPKSDSCHAKQKRKSVSLFLRHYDT